MPYPCHIRFIQKQVHWDEAGCINSWACRAEPQNGLILVVEGVVFHCIKCWVLYSVFPILIKALLYLIPLALEYCQLLFNVQGIFMPLDGTQ